MSIRTLTLLAGLLVEVALGPTGAVAQAAGPPREVASERPVFGGHDWALVGGLVAAQLVLLPLDGEIRESASEMRSDRTDAVSGVLRPLGRKDVFYLGSAAAYALGRLAGRDRLADVGVHAFASLALASLVTGTLKGLAGRARPWALETAGGDSTWVLHGPMEWRVFAGWTEGGWRQAYPSGHTTTAFAVATVVAEELGGAAPWLAYPVAAGVGWSRLNDEAHWATDVLMGALVGIVSGRLVVRHGHQSPGWLERTLLFEPAVGRSGALIGVRLPVGGRVGAAATRD